MEPVNGNCTGDFCTWKKCVQEKVIMFPSLTVKFIKTPLKALFYLGFSAVPFRFTL